MNLMHWICGFATFLSFGRALDLRRGGRRIDPRNRTNPWGLIIQGNEGISRKSSNLYEEMAVLVLVRDLTTVSTINTIALGTLTLKCSGIFVKIIILRYFCCRNAKWSFNQRNPLFWKDLIMDDNFWTMMSWMMIKRPTSKRTWMKLNMT